MDPATPDDRPRAFPCTRCGVPLVVLRVERIVVGKMPRVAGEAILFALEQELERAESGGRREWGRGCRPGLCGGLRFGFRGRRWFRLQGGLRSGVGVELGVQVEVQVDRVFEVDDGRLRSL